MNEFIELIDLTSGNVVGDFADVEEAMATLCEVAARHGRNAITNLSLMRIDGEAQSLVAMQEELANMVEAYRRAGIVAASILG